MNYPANSAELLKTSLGPEANIEDFSPHDLITPELFAEIEDAERKGYDISIGEGRDEAYDSPEMVRGVYELIDSLSGEFDRRKQDLMRRGIGTAAFLSTPNRRRGAQKELYQQLEPHRRELILDHTESWAWHEQRGCATALLTITDAHDLAVNKAEDGLYPTMSGALDSSVLYYQFGNANSLTGLDLRPAVIDADMRFRGSDFKTAARRADRRLEKLEEFVAAPVNRDFKDIVQYCSDSLGIRSRKEEVREAIGEHVDARLERDPGLDNLTMMSFGCGTAPSMLEVVGDLKEKGVKSKVILLDQDPIALASAAILAKNKGLEDSIEIHCERLFSRIGRPIKMQSLLKGRKIDVYEDSGLREYLDDMIYKGLTKEVWNNLADDGLMTTGNMNTNRAQASFLHGLMGWTPKVQMRGINEGVRLHEKAGVPKGATRIRITPDGIYTMLYSSKAEARR